MTMEKINKTELKNIYIYKVDKPLARLREKERSLK